MRRKRCWRFCTGVWKGSASFNVGPVQWTLESNITMGLNLPLGKDLYRNSCITIFCLAANFILAVNLFVTVKVIEWAFEVTFKRLFYLVNRINSAIKTFFIPPLRSQNTLNAYFELLIAVEDIFWGINSRVGHQINTGPCEVGDRNMEPGCEFLKSFAAMEVVF